MTSMSTRFTGVVALRGGGLQRSNHASNGPRLAGPSCTGSGGRLRFLGQWMAGGGVVIGTCMELLDDLGEGRVACGVR